MAAAAQRYQVVGKPRFGTFSESEVHTCPQCTRGQKQERGRLVKCDWCGGYGKLLGASALYWPTPVTLVEAELVEEAPAGAPGRAEVPRADANTSSRARPGQQLELVVDR